MRTLPCTKSFLENVGCELTRTAGKDMGLFPVRRTVSAKPPKNCALPGSRADSRGGSMRNQVGDVQ